MLQAAPRDTEFFFQHRPIFHHVKQAQRRLVHRRALEREERCFLHQVFEPLGNRAFTAADRAQQIENLLTLFQALSGMAKEADHLLDGIFHTVEL